MLNGDPFASPTEWKKIRAFFQGLSPILSSFAATHNLAIDEYYHESPSWAFRFRHPKGGAAGIHVERLDDSTIRVGRSWYIDEFENFTRYLKSDEGSDLTLGGIDLREILEAKLQDIVTWKKSDMIAHSDYGKYWSRYSKEEWAQMSSVERLPQPKL
ncbi:MAG TPA: hypothetical protein VIX11_01785 [Candidatus Acidoferrum sp.]